MSTALCRLSKLYDSLVHQRHHYFPGTDDNCACVPYVGSTFCTASFLEFEIAKTDLTVRVKGSDRRMVSRIVKGVAECKERQKRYCWILIKLFRTEDYAHSNALLIDVEQHESWLFEPHGSDPTHPLHGDGFFCLYDAAQYFAMCGDLVGRAVPDSRFHSPAEYQPAMFGQSVSRLGKGESADRFCAFWSLYFLVEATRSSPHEFVLMIQQAYRRGTLHKVAGEALENLSLNLRMVMRR